MVSSTDSILQLIIRRLREVKSHSWELANQAKNCWPYSSHTMPGIRKLWPEDQIQPTTCICKQSFIGTWQSSFVYILSMAAFIYQQQSWAVTTEARWPTKPKIFTIWHSAEQVCPPLVQATLAKIKCLSHSNLLKVSTRSSESTELAIKTEAFQWP